MLITTQPQFELSESMVDLVQLDKYLQKSPIMFHRTIIVDSLRSMKFLWENLKYISKNPLMMM